MSESTVIANQKQILSNQKTIIANQKHIKSEKPGQPGHYPQKSKADPGTGQEVIAEQFRP